MEHPTPLTNGNESVQTISSHLPSSLSDQFYRQSKIDEENRRLKKKSKGEKKSKKKSHLPSVDDNDDDLYPTIKVTRGGELPDGMTESGNEDTEGDKKNKKADPHRALNIDLNDKPVAIQPPPPPPEVPKPPSPPVEKPKKLKTKKKVKEEENIAIAPPPVVEEKAKKKKKSKPSTDANTSAPLLLDIINDDISSMNPSDQHTPGQDTFQLAAQSDHLIIVNEKKSSYELINFVLFFSKDYSINASASLAQLDVTFLLKNQTSFIIDHLDIHIIDSLSSKLLNTTSANRISFPSISLFPHSQNYLHIYFNITAIAFPQKLKTTLTYSINVRQTFFFVFCMNL